MNFKTSAFGCIIAFAFLPGCTSKSQLHESASDTLVTVYPDTAMDPVTGLRPGEYINPESLPKVFTTYDSIQEFNIRDGIFKDRESPIDTAIKMYFYASDLYSEPVIKDGEEFIGVFPDSSANNLSFYRLERVTFRYNPEMQYSYPPPVDEAEDKWPVFYLKGISLNNVKGKVFPYMFVEPGSTLSIQLGDRHYSFSIEGKRDKIQATDWAMPFVRDYRLILSEVSPEGKNEVLLIGKKYMPFPNEGDASTDFIDWAGDLNNDGLIDIISANSAKVCGTYYLWMGAPQLKFKLATRFFVCGC